MTSPRKVSEKPNSAPFCKVTDVTAPCPMESSEVVRNKATKPATCCGIIGGRGVLNFGAVAESGGQFDILIRAKNNSRARH